MTRQTARQGVSEIRPSSDVFLLDLRYSKLCVSKAFFFVYHFFVAGNATYNSLCRSVGRSVGWSASLSVGRSVTFLKKYSLFKANVFYGQAISISMIHAKVARHV